MWASTVKTRVQEPQVTMCWECSSLLHTHTQVTAYGFGSLLLSNRHVGACNPSTLKLQLFVVLQLWFDWAQWGVCGAGLIESVPSGCGHRKAGVGVHRRKSLQWLIRSLSCLRVIPSQVVLQMSCWTPHITVHGSREKILRHEMQKL